MQEDGEDNPRNHGKTPDLEILVEGERECDTYRCGRERMEERCADKAQVAGHKRAQKVSLLEGRPQK
jgi:hypothetical protein